RCPGLTSTSWQRRLATGRGHAPALLSPTVMMKWPRSLTRTGVPAGIASPGPGETATLHYAGRSRPGGPGHRRTRGRPQLARYLTGHGGVVEVDHRMPPAQGL